MKKYDKLFIQLLYIFHTSAMQALGKVKNPVTNKFDKNFEQAKQSIDMLEMIKEKTKNNLSNELSDTLNSFLTEIQMNYVKEINKN
jgi:gas vesicle protein